MKGVVFRQFLEFAEKEFGEAKIDELLRTTDLESAGVYTNVDNSWLALDAVCSPRLLRVTLKTVSAMPLT